MHDRSEIVDQRTLVILCADVRSRSGHVSLLARLGAAAASPASRSRSLLYLRTRASISRGALNSSAMPLSTCMPCASEDPEESCYSRRARQRNGVDRPALPTFGSIARNILQCQSTTKLHCGNRKPPEGGFLSALSFGSGQTEVQTVRSVLAAIGQEAEARKTQHHHRPGRRLRHGRDFGRVRQRDVGEGNRGG